MLYDSSHPELKKGKKLVVKNDKDEVLKAVIRVDTTNGWAEVYEGQEMQHADIKNERGEVVHKGAPFFMVKKDGGGKPIKKRIFGKFTVSFVIPEEELPLLPQEPSTK